MSDSPRDVLLQKAIDHFIAHGVGDISLRALATHIGTSHRMLIYHFGSREGLLAATVEHIWGSQLDTLEDLAEATPDDPAEGAWLYWTMLANRSAVSPFIFEVSAQAMHGAPWSTSFREGADRLVQGVADRLVAAGEEPRRAEILARMLMAVLRGALWELRITEDRQSADTTVRTFLDEMWPSSVPD